MPVNIPAFRAASQRAVAGPPPEVEGDPDFLAGKYDPTAIFPAEAAQKRLETNQAAAQKQVALLTELGLEIPDDIRETAMKGFISPKPTLFDRILAILDNPRRTVNLAIQDIAGGRAKGGKEDPTFGDYMQTLFTTDKERQVAEKTGLDPISGSYTLELFGWEPEDKLGGKIGRGVTAFALEVLTDPLTYLTFGASALGKKVLGKTGKTLVDDASTAVYHYANRGSMEGLGAFRTKMGITGESVFVPGSAASKRLTTLVDETAMKYYDTRLAPWVGKDEAMRQARKAAVPDVLRQTSNDIMVPLVSKDFSSAALSPFIDVLPAYATGGARISFPFLGRKSLQYGIYIPGTRGLGRAVGTKVKEVPGIKQIANAMKKNRPTEKAGAFLAGLKDEMDLQGALLRGVKNGNIDGYQYLLALEAMEASMIRGPIQAFTAQMNASQETITRLYKKEFALSAEEAFERSSREIYDFVIAAQRGDEYVKQVMEDWIRTANPSARLRSEVAAFIGNWRGHSRTAKEAFDSIDPGIMRNLPGYMPQMFAPGARDWVHQVVLKYGAVDAALAETDYGAFLLAQILRGVGGGSQIDKALGMSTHHLARELGKHPFVTLATGGDVAYVNPLMVAQRAGNIASGDLADLARQGADVLAAQIDSINPNHFVGSTAMNDSIEGLVTRMADDLGVPLPKAGGARLFDEDPWRITNSYMRDMNRAYRERKMIENMKHAGLVIDHKTELSVSEALGELSARLKADPKLAKKLSRASTEGLHKPVFGPTERTQVAAAERLRRGAPAEIKGLADRPLGGTQDDIYEWSHNAFDQGVRDEFGGIKYTTRSPSPGTRQGLTDEFDGLDAMLEGNHGALIDLDTNRVAQVEPGTRVHYDAEYALDPRRDAVAWSEAYEQGRAVRITYDIFVEGDDAIESGVGRFGIRTVEQRIAAGDATMEAIVNLDAMTPAMRRRTLNKLHTLAEMSGHKRIKLFEFAADPADHINATPYIQEVSKAGKFSDELLVDNMIDTIRATYLRTGAMELLNDTTRAAMMEGFVKNYGADNVAKIIGATDELVRAQSRVHEMNQILDQLGLGMLSPERATTATLDVGPTFAKGDPFYDLLRRAAEVGQDLDLKLGPISEAGKATTATTAREVLHQPGAGVLARATKEVATEPGFVDPHIFALGGPGLEKKLVQQDLARFFRNWLKNEATIYTPAGLANVKQGVNKFMKWWKGMATVARPTFHTRNLVSGVWMNQTIGVRARDYLSVRAGMLQIRNAMDRGATLGDAIKAISNPTRREKFRALFDSGLLDVSFSRSTFSRIDTAGRNKLSQYISLVNPASPDFGLIRGGARVMESVEDFLRASAFFAWVDPTDVKGTSLVAKEMALAVHFDYQHLTRFETKVKEFVPFFVWARRNVPLQLQIMLEQPGIMNRYQHLLNAASDQFPAVEQDAFPVSDYWHSQAVGTDVVLNPETPFWARLVLDPDLPVTDLLELDLMNPIDFGKHIVSMVGPQWTEPLSLLQQQDYGDVLAPQPMGAVLRQLGNLGFWDVPAEGDSVSLPYWMRSLYNTAFPFAREVVETPIGPSDPKQAAALGAPGGNILGRLGLTLGKGVVGAKLQTPGMTPGVDYRTDRRVQDIMEGLRHSGQIGQGEEEDFKERWRRLSSEQKEDIWKQVSGS
jgi:hypothetical protein